MMFFYGKMVSAFLLIAMVFPLENICLEIETPPEYMDEDLFKIQPSKKVE